jgi:LmbE family N-acetylglucosaminyl deacetylase
MRVTDLNPEPTRILIVDGDCGRADAARRLLAELGEVTATTDADGALALLLTGEWNVVIVSQQLRDMEGVELLQALPYRDPEPVKLVIGGRGFDDALSAIRAGARDYVADTAGPGELLHRVRDAVNADRLARRRRPAERVLAIGAHPDDVEVGCGGILLRHRDAGHALTIATLSDGERGGAGETRRGESQQSAALLSARLVMAGLNDTLIPEGGATIASLSRVIDEVRPTTIYTHTDNDSHQDHRSVHRATLVAARTVPRVYAYQSPSTRIEFRPQVFVSIDDVLERKLALIEPHASQTQVRSYLAADLLRATARYWGRFGTSLYAEPLEVVRQADVSAAPFGPGSPVVHAFGGVDSVAA